MTPHLAWKIFVSRSYDTVVVGSSRENKSARLIAGIHRCLVIISHNDAAEKTIDISWQISVAGGADLPTEAIRLVGQ